MKDWQIIAVALAAAAGAYWFLNRQPAAGMSPGAASNPWLNGSRPNDTWANAANSGNWY